MLLIKTPPTSTCPSFSCHSFFLQSFLSAPFGAGVVISHRSTAEIPSYEAKLASFGQMSVNLCRAVAPYHLGAVIAPRKRSSVS